MSSDIVIIGSGFAARQLIKNLRQQNKEAPIRLIAADSCDEYHKPELSHVFSLGQRADDLTRMTAAEYAEKNNVTLHPHTRVSRIDAAAHRIETTAGDFTFGKLVLATGAEALVPPVSGSELMYTLNSQQEYRRCEENLRGAKRVLLIGGGLIGTELAMDLNRAGKQVTLVDRSGSLLSALMPPEISGRLQHRLTLAGVEMRFNCELSSLARHHDTLIATLNNGQQIACDAAVCAIGLRPNIALAQQAGLETRRGIVVDDRLTTSRPDIFALGDCAEIQGKLMPYLQPAQLAAMTLAKNLTGNSASLSLPAMLVRIKTPDLPLHLAGNAGDAELNWEMQFSKAGIVAKGLDAAGQLKAFVVSEDHMKQALPLLKQLTR
ncbi:MAG: NADH:flavorubredoxin reductase NorW [Mixta calida]|uniref:NADH:flavorubredoxin reductase NorW n=1 Tax=Mixta calida TaxID=665913 RepID=UPI0028FE1FD4|nr:NADH:flavorubredoxin reductase NorW [Mixta calida]MDU2733660.1 NADH:flavorubredoxin reductase NorW [Mixta calida]MDU4941569.1 NADH:flavorubredoxin reductase NorW [Mixta calida]